MKHIIFIILGVFLFSGLAVADPYFDQQQLQQEQLKQQQLQQQQLQRIFVDLQQQLEMIEREKNAKIQEIMRTQPQYREGFNSESNTNQNQTNNLNDYYNSQRQHMNSIFDTQRQIINNNR